MQKEAAEQDVAATIQECMQDAAYDADLLINHLRKVAAGSDDADMGENHCNEGGEAEAHPTGGDAGGDAGGMGDELAGGAGGGTPEVSEEQVLQELVAALAEMGITPDELMEAMAGAGGGAGGGMPPDAAMAGGGMPPDAAGGAPMEDPAGIDPAAEGMKLASAAKRFQRSGRFQLKAAAAGSLERRLREELKYTVQELLKTAQRR